MKERAVVLETKNQVVTVVTAGGEFRKVRLKGDFRPGQEIFLPEKGWRPGRLALIAACLLLFFTFTALWRPWVDPAVAAYVSLEINPGVELALDRDGVVRGVRPLDDGGKDLAAGLDLRGMPLEEAVDRVLAEAVSKDIITAPEGVVMFTVTPVGDLDLSRVEGAVRDSAGASLKSRGISARVVVGSASPEVREKAEQEGISTGRYMLYMDALQKGIPVAPQDFRGKSVNLIEREKHIRVMDSLKVEAEVEKNHEPGSQDGVSSRDRESGPGKGGGSRQTPPGQQKTWKDSGRGDESRGVSEGAGETGREPGINSGRDSENDSGKDSGRLDSPGRSQVKDSKVPPGWPQGTGGRDKGKDREKDKADGGGVQDSGAAAPAGQPSNAYQGGESGRDGGGQKSSKKEDAASHRGGDRGNSGR